MDEAISISLLTKEKEMLLDQILENIRSWDKTLESGISIIESNQELLEEIDFINVRLSESGHENNNETSCNSKLIMISKELEQLISWMKNLKKSVLEEKRVLEKKEEMVGSYIATNNNSVFIDKNV